MCSWIWCRLCLLIVIIVVSGGVKCRSSSCLLIPVIVLTVVVVILVVETGILELHTLDKTLGIDLNRLSKASVCFTLIEALAAAIDYPC